MRSTLFLEDDPNDCTLVERILKGSDALTVVKNKREFESVVKDRKFDAILSDIAVPGYDGKEALRFVLKTRPHTAFIFVTGSITDEEGAKLLALGATDYIIKDRLSRLENAIARAIKEKKLENELIRTQRLESVGAVASGVIHDTNNCLGPVTMVLEMLREDMTRERRLELLSVAQRSAQRLVDMQHQLLTFVRGENGVMKPVKLDEVVLLAVKLLRETFPPNVRIETTMQADTIVQGNATQLGQVVINLCVNARDAMPDGGKLEVSVEMLADEQMAKVRVKDTGTGMPAAVMARVFEPFFTTKDPGKGTGLGLSTTKQIVTMHGGHIDVVSAERKGTTFDVFLPLAAAAEEADEKKAPPPPVVEGSGQTILLVDDEAAIAEVTKMLLEISGYRVLTAANGAEALSVFRKSPEVKIVVTDWLMPVLSADAFIPLLRSVRDVPVVVISGDVNDDVRRAKPTAVLQKPYRNETLLTVLAGVLQPTP
jgi:signal transduction histidine kinase